ncbi:hypothetical protein AS9A_P20075 (plasmid) [Hoyosella subflava DQS3-9A1]|uniref:Uncharacterized protein n=1 Tax=Hoyosella subflava (strain DSM 45089 / JCM 17490 / NBRC 109087 / DQS3-9A1) TaxID=443218 RepID=F6ESJ8_HOYSD|nr:hypothetical protein AS9A_P20075 [Hoyosella subflava DQS3-9A1]
MPSIIRTPSDTHTSAHIEVIDTTGSGPRVPHHPAGNRKT